LTPSNFGDVQVFISLITQTGIIFGAFSIVAVNITANVENIHERNAILAELQKICFYVIGALAIILLLFFSRINAFLNLGSIYPLVGVLAILFLSVSSTFRSAYLQGKGRFVELSISGIISSAGRLIFAVILILLGISSLGAVGGIIAAQIAVVYFLLSRTKNSLNLSTHSNVHVLEQGAIKKELLYGILVLFAGGLVTFMYTSDILIVKHLFNPHDAGLYSGISAIAKIIFFVVSPITAVLLPAIKLKNSAKENSIILIKSLGISLILGGAGLLVFCLFSDITIRVLLGSQYQSFAYLLPKVGVVMLLSSILNVFVNYFLALRRFVLVWISLAGVLCTGFLLLASHNSINSVLNDLTSGLSILLGLFIIIYVKNYFNRRTGIQ
jgi:O-antigen/teichoic acid export membrane protein